ncbi:unnamed protein product [Ectocarpus sp. 13 AM-2016]
MPAAQQMYDHTFHPDGARGRSRRWSTSNTAVPPGFCTACCKMR